MRPNLARPYGPFARLLAFVTIAALSVALVACSSSPGSSGVSPSASGGPSTSGAAGFPVTIRAANGTVRVPARPSAIISLSPTATEMLYAIGAGDQVKMVDEYSTYPPDAPRSKMTGLSPNIEALAGQRPDLIVIDSDRGGLTKRMASFSIPVLVLPAAVSLDDVYREINDLGAATGHRAEATAKVTSIRAELAQIAGSTRRPAAPQTYYYELQPDYYSVTSATFVGRLLGLLGLRSIADGAGGPSANGGYPKLSAEYIIKTNPDHIFLADAKCCKQSAATVAARPGWSGIEAVTARRVVPLDDDIASRWGPRIVDLVRVIAAALNR